MTTIITLSPSITSLDAQPAFRLPTGEGSSGMARILNDSVNAATTDVIGTIYKILRVPTNIKLKRLYLLSTVASTGAADFDLTFSDNPTDGTPPALAVFASSQPTPGIIQINQTTPADNKLFGAAVAFGAGGGLTLTELTFKNQFTMANQNQPLWQVLQTGVQATEMLDPRITIAANQFVGDPGGFFDIVAKITTAPGAAGTVGMLCEYVE